MADYDINIWDKLAYNYPGEMSGGWKADLYELREDGSHVDKIVKSIHLSSVERRSLDSLIGDSETEVDTWLYLESAPDWLKERIEND